jgi:hypothetical protein
MREVAIAWRRLDLPGHEFARLVSRPPMHRLEGTAVFVHEARPCWLHYAIVCDDAWRTRSALVHGWLGTVPVRRAIDVSADGTWRLNGQQCADTDGCVDIDLAFSPSTNLLPIRRLALSVGQHTEVHAAWVTFPDLTLTRLVQNYERTASTHYRYTAGNFHADIDVNEEGFVTRYADQWELSAMR